MAVSKIPPGASACRRMRVQSWERPYSLRFRQNCLKTERCVWESCPQTVTQNEIWCASRFWQIKLETRQMVIKQFYLYPILKLFFKLQQMLFQCSNDWQNKYTHLIPVYSRCPAQITQTSSIKTTQSKEGLQAGLSICFYALPPPHFPVHPSRDDTAFLMLPVSQIRLLECRFVVKFQAAKYAHETFAAALLGAQKGSKAEARTEWAQTSPKPIFHLASHSSKQDRQQTS